MSFTNQLSDKFPGAGRSLVDGVLWLFATMKATPILSRICHTTAKCESVWTFPSDAPGTMNESKRLTHYMTVAPIAFRHNLVNGAMVDLSCAQASISDKLPFRRCL